MARLLYTIRDKLNEITVKRSISANFLTLDSQRELELIASLKTNYLANLSSDPDYVDSDIGQQDLQDHLYGRLWDDRRTVIPWLDSLSPLQGASILEVGCGPGASTVAFAEQGALVTGVELEANNLKVANDRCRLYGLRTSQFHVMNGAEIGHLGLEGFDFIIFSACLEHMTLKERLSALRPAWSRLKAGGLLVVAETPNRLWWYDAHTSLLPFFNWLPDDLAIEYSSRSNRHYFNELYHPPIDEPMRLNFSRWGRGVSYHEFELSIPELRQVDISCMNIWVRKRNPMQLAKHIISGDQRFARTLARIAGKTIHPAFYESFLNLAIRKPTDA
jgi:2-polyprenyl-3-methyl-5-hydroxy-6-metoxy-1,4-benzoquinol methylase